MAFPNTIPSPIAPSWPNAAPPELQTRQVDSDFFDILSSQSSPACSPADGSSVPSGVAVASKRQRPAAASSNGDENAAEAANPPALPSQPIGPNGDLPEDAAAAQQEDAPPSVEELGRQALKLAPSMSADSTKWNWRGKRPDGDYLKRMRSTDFNDPKSIDKNFPKFKDSSKYGQLQVPQPLLDQFSRAKNKVHAIMNWRRLTPKQQKAMKKQFTEEKKRANDANKKIDSAVVAMVQKDLQEHDEWYNHVDEAEQWWAANAASRAAYEAARLENDSAAMLDALHAINGRYEGCFNKLLRKAEVEMDKEAAAERRAARAAAREQEDEENDLVSHMLCY